MKTDCRQSLVTESWKDHTVQVIWFFIVIAIFSLLTWIPYVGPVLSFPLAFVIGIAIGYTILEGWQSVALMLLAIGVLLFGVVNGRPGFIHFSLFFMVAHCGLLGAGRDKGLEMAKDED